jgi:hypothetical protein
MSEDDALTEASSCSQFPSEARRAAKVSARGSCFGRAFIEDAEEPRAMSLPKQNFVARLPPSEPNYFVIALDALCLLNLKVRDRAQD